jgi:squalene synthase HpnC
MTGAADLRSGKGHHDENFPVASWLIHPRHRAPILAFYEFVRVADDIADHASLAPREKIALLDRLEDGLTGKGEAEPVAARLRDALAMRGLSPRHAQDLLTAFRMDATKLRYRDWDDLIHYCAYSAMPVGRFVLDVHGESRGTWPANDALCAALQIINHLQDCGADYRNLDRVYIPQDAFARHGTTVEALAEPKASPELRSCLRDVAERTAVLLRAADPFSMSISDVRLGLEVAVIHRVAQALTQSLTGGFAALGLLAVAEELGRRAARLFGGGRHKPQDA